MPLAPAAPDKTAEAGIYGFSLSSSSHQPRTGRRDHSTKSCMIGKQIKVSRLMRGEREEAWLENRCVCLCVGGEREREKEKEIENHPACHIFCLPPSFDTLTLPLTHNSVFSFWRHDDEIMERAVDYRFWNKIGFIPPNMCSARLRRNLTTFNKSLFVAWRLTQKSGACLLCL